MVDARRPTGVEFKMCCNFTCHISVISGVDMDRDGVSPGKICKEPTATQILGH